ncbi:MAG: hypothetical protein ACK5Q6_09450 [Cyanobacteriota bacterium]
MDELAQPKIEVIITVAEDRRAKLKQIASELQNKGLEINSEPLENLGIITGLAEEKSIEQLKNVNGVTAVEPSMPVQIAPPESDIQ